MPEKDATAKNQIFEGFMRHVVGLHRQGDPAAGWIAAAHAIRAAKDERWGSIAEEIATCLEKSYLDGVVFRAKEREERQKEEGRKVRRESIKDTKTPAS